MPPDRPEIPLLEIRLYYLKNKNVVVKLSILSKAAFLEVNYY